MHFCGGLDDLLYIPLYLLLLIPGMKIAYAWLRAKLGGKKAANCCECHSEEK